MSTHGVSQLAWERMFSTMEKVRDRLRRATAAFERIGIPYAMVGDQAVGVWISQVDDAAVRITPDVDVLVRREDFALLRASLEGEGFCYESFGGDEIFLDHAGAHRRSALFVFFAGERYRPEDDVALPHVAESTASHLFRVINLDALVRMKLTTHRLKDRVHVRDMIDVGLVDATWLVQLPVELRPRLQHLLDTPDG